MSIVGCVVCMSGCFGGDKSADSNRPDESERDKDNGGPSMDSIGMIGSALMAQLEQPGPYDEPRESAGFDNSAPHFGVVELSGSVVELSSYSWTSQVRGRELRSIVKRLRALAERGEMAGLIVRAHDLQISFAAAQELRSALMAYKAQGKRLACHMESVSNVTYYILSVCDSIGLAPTGGIVISGVSATPLHVKGLLDKLEIHADFLHVGAFKGAAEPMTRERPSKEMVRTLGAILDRAYRTLVNGVASGRNLEPKKTRKLIDRAAFHGENAVKAGLADVVTTFETFRDSEAKGAWTKLKWEPKKKPGLARLLEFVGIAPTIRPSSPHVAVVYAVGNVVDGKGGGVVGARGEIASRTVVAALRSLLDNDAVKAVVLRVDSPGGSALASELIWHAVTALREKKPVVVSMGSVAASGGYYISAPATKIYAQDNTLTGSIGVVGGKLAVNGLLQKVGIRSYPMKRGKRALLYSSLDKWTDDERATVQELMDAVYRTFVTRVAAGRNKSYDEIHKVAQGRVWTGADAVKQGLVDALGGLEDAVAEARTLGNVDDSTPLEVYPPSPTLIDFVQSFRGTSTSLVNTEPSGHCLPV